MSEVIKQHLERAKHRMKRQAYKGRSERSFAVGDWVFLAICSVVHSSKGTPKAGVQIFWTVSD